MPETSPAELHLTAIGRSLADLAWQVRSGAFNGVPAVDEAAKGMAVELKNLRRRTNILYLATTVAAFLLMATTSGSDFDVLGLHIPFASLSKPAFALILSGVYLYFLSGLISYVLLHWTFASLFARSTDDGNLIFDDGWEYIAARYDAEMLWMTLLRPKQGGYVSPSAERWLSRIAQTPNMAIVFAQLILVVVAIGATAGTAIGHHDVVGSVVGLLAFVGVAGSIVAAASALFLKLRYAPAATGP